MESIYRNGKWITEEPKNNLDLTKPLNIYVSSMTTKDRIEMHNLETINEVEKYNENKQNEIQEAQGKRIEELAHGYLKVNEMI